MASKPKDDRRPAWGFFYDHKIGKVRPLCGDPKPKGSKGTRKS